MSAPRSCRPGCGLGYCDYSAGLCICPPGVEGARCDQPRLPSCRVSERKDAIMPCDGFHGVMSCRCMEECWERMERHTARGWFITAMDKICFTARSGQVPTQSDMPANISGLLFFIRAKMKLPSGWEVDQSLPRSSSGRLLQQPIIARLSRVNFQAIRPVKIIPLPNSHCPQSCNHAGTCVETVGAGNGAHCLCHQGFTGPSCSQVDASECVNQCSGHGQCISRFCLCHDGWFGLDCSLSLRAPSRRAPLVYAPTYVYPLPTELTMEFAFQRDSRRRGMFYTNRVFLEMLHTRHDALVGDPETAVLFFVPVMLTQMRDSLWEAKRFWPFLLHYIRNNFPFWNVSNGADHYFFTGQDLGGCWVPAPIASSAIIVSHFGFRGTLWDWIDAPMWQRARHMAQGWYSESEHPSRQSHKCFLRRKDIVVPVDFRVTNAQRNLALSSLGTCKSSQVSQSLIYMSGSMRTRYSSFYSQGVRQ